MWPTIASSGFASASPMRAIEEPIPSVLSSANDAASRHDGRSRALVAGGPGRAQ